MKNLIIALAALMVLVAGCAQEQIAGEMETDDLVAAAAMTFVAICSIMSSVSQSSTKT